MSLLLCCTETRTLIQRSISEIVVTDGKTNMKKLLLLILLLMSPIVSADMDDLCFVYIKEFGTNDILNAVEGQGCVRNNVLQVVYGMDNASETIMMFHSGRWCRFDRNMEIKGAVLSCVLYATKPRRRLDKGG
jgi:hypothetical protein